MAKGAVAKVTFVANAKSLINATKNINRNISTLTSGFTKLGRYAKLAFGVFAANQAIGGLKGLVSAGEQAVQSARRLQAIFEAQGLTGTAVYKQLGEQTRDISLDLGIQGEVVQEVQAKLALFGRAFAVGTQGAKDFGTATRLAFDFESAGLGSALQGAEVLGKALSDPLKASAILKKAGILLTQEQIKELETLVTQGKIAEAQALIIRDVQGIIGGTAEATALASTKIGLAIGDIVESISLLLLPVLDPIAKGFRRISDSITGTVEKTGGLNGIWNNYLVPIGKAVTDTFTSLRNSLGLTNTFFSAVWDIVKIGLGVLAELFKSVFGNKALNDTFISTLRSLWNAFEAVFQFLAKFFLPILEQLLKIVLPPLIAIFNGLVKVIQFLLSVLLNVIGTLADFITFVGRGLVKLGEWVTKSQLVADVLQVLAKGFSAVADFIVDLGKSIGVEFIANVVQSITGAIGKVWDVLNQVKNKVADFFANLFDVGKRSDFEITVPKITTPTPSVKDVQGSLKLPAIGSFTTPQSPKVAETPKTIVKELPTKTKQSTTPAVVNNYNIKVDTLKPDAQVGKTVVDSIKQYASRSGGKLIPAGLL